MRSPLARNISRATILVAAVAVLVSAAGIASAVPPLTTVSTDPYTNTSSYHQTQVEPDTYSFGSTTVAAFQVGRFQDGGSSNLGFATTTNDGTSWTNGFMPGTTVYANPPGPWARISDPSVVFDARHDVWMIIGLVLDALPSAHGLVLNRSTDGGLTWQNPVTVSLNQGFYDKQWITCDNTATSPFYGNCYAEWAGNSGITMSRSTDGGLTWNQSNTPNTGGNGGQPVVQDDGKVVVPFAGSGIQTIVSTNGGASYTGPFTVASISTHPVAGGIRAVLLPSAERDGGGTIYVVWWDCRFRAGCSTNDIVMTTSANGSTWTPVVRIPIDTVDSTFDHFLMGIGADLATQGATAHLGLIYYFYPQANCSTNTCRLQAGYISSPDGGISWSRAVRLTGAMRLTWLPSTTLGYMVGDYNSLSFGTNARAYPVFAVARGPGNCTLGQITSCNEAMNAPTAGLPVGPAFARVNPNERIAVTPNDKLIPIPRLW